MKYILRRAAVFDNIIKLAKCKDHPITKLVYINKT